MHSTLAHTLYTHTFSAILFVLALLSLECGMVGTAARWLGRDTAAVAACGTGYRRQA